MYELVRSDDAGAYAAARGAHRTTRYEVHLQQRHVDPPRPDGGRRRRGRRRRHPRLPRGGAVQQDRDGPRAHAVRRRPAPGSAPSRPDSTARDFARVSASSTSAAASGTVTGSSTRTGSSARARPARQPGVRRAVVARLATAGRLLRDRHPRSGHHGGPRPRPVIVQLSTVGGPLAARPDRGHPRRVHLRRAVTVAVDGRPGPPAPTVAGPARHDATR